MEGLIKIDVGGFEKQLLRQPRWLVGGEAVHLLVVS